MTYEPDALAVALIVEFEGAQPRLKAEMCEGGAYELGWGSTYHLDGTPVEADDTCTLEYAIRLRTHAMAIEAGPVWKALKVVPTQNQINALASLAYNIGGSAAAGSSVVTLLNQGRVEDAAAAFSMWNAATSSGPSPRERGVPAGIHKDGRWIGPDDQPCKYFRRFRGLLRRRHAEGCLFLGYDWREACKDDAVSMRTDRVWNATKNRWEDKIVSFTQFSEILDVARKYPLPSPKIAAEPDPPKPAPVKPVKAEPLPEVKPVAPVPIPAPPLPTPVEKPVSVPKPQPTLPNDFDPNAGAKAMVYSRRFWGWVLIILGRFSFATDAGAGLVAQTGGAVGAVANGIAADPILLDAYTGFAVMIAGEAVRWWGEKKATKVLK